MPIGSIGPTRGRALERLRDDERLSALVAEEDDSARGGRLGAVAGPLLGRVPFTG